MLEAFERHLNTIEISRKFDNAKTNDERIVIAKEFLEKHGYEVSKKEKPRSVGLNPDTRMRHAYNNPFDDPFITSHEDRQSPYSKILTVSTQLDEHDLYAMRSSAEANATERLIRELSHGIMKSDFVTRNTYKNTDYRTVTYNMKLGVFKP